MKLIEDRKLTDAIEKAWRKNKLKFKEVYVLNTSWATDKEGNRDVINRACFIRLQDNSQILYWLISEPELFKLLRDLSEVAIFNRENDNTGKKWNNKKLEDIQ